MSGHRGGHSPQSPLAQARRLHRQGQLQAARALYQRVPGNHPDFAAALNGLGLIAQQGGDGQTAIRLLRKAVGLAPKNPELRANLGNLLARAGRLQEARQELTRAVSLAPEAAGIHNNLGLALQRLGLPAEAAAAFARAAELAPGRALFHANRGSALADAGDLEAAHEAQKRAVALDPRLGEAWNNLGLLQSRRREWADALRCLETAATLAPETPSVWVNLSNVRRAFGRLEAARAAAGRALALAPQSPDAHQAWAATGRFEQADREIERLERLLQEERLPPRERSNCSYALGKLLDDSGSYDRAFAAFAAANRLQARHFSAPDTAARFQALAEQFGARFARGCAAGASQSQRPVFVVGMPRSGTTLVEQIVASHPAAAGVGELPNLERYLLACEAADGDPAPETLTGFIEDYLATLERFAPGAARVVDKRPFNFLALGLVRALFPRARILHCTRDPRDTCLSIFFTNFSEKHGFSTRLADIGAFYCLYADLLRRWEEIFPGAIHTVDYARLVEDQEAETRRLLAHLELPWDPACLAFHRQERPVDTPSDWQVRQPLHDRSLGRWRHYESHLAPLLEALAPVLSRPPAPPQASRGS